MARLKDLENLIKQAIEDYPVDSDEIYTAIYNLCVGYIMRYKKLNNPADVDGVATVAAETMHLCLLKGGSIVSWIGYLVRGYPGYLKAHYDMTESEIFDTASNLELADAIKDMCASQDNTREFQRILDKDYLLNLVKVIDSVLEISRYRKGSKNYRLAKLSIILSITKGEVVYFDLPESEQLYTNTLLSVIKDRVTKFVAVGNFNSEDIGQYTQFQTEAIESGGRAIG